MQEVLPGVFHWTSLHPRIHVQVSSYWLEEAGVLIDPLVPHAAGLEWFAERALAPVAILLSNRHHYREADRFTERFGCPVYCNRLGLQEFSLGEPVQGFDVGDLLPGGFLACEVSAICPDDTALHLPSARVLVLADGVVRGGPHGGDDLLGFVPDSLMDDPPATKRGLLCACAALLEELDFVHLLLAHGGPLIDDGRERLQELVDAGGRAAFEM
jgi:glyoxylase-like metal-dependent hydrolase (beta-lactamase superfamily II)